MLPDKQRVLAVLCDQLKLDVAIATRLAKDAADAVTHPENRQEGDKDMRGTEASYVARGQAERVHELERDLLTLRAMPCLDFTERRGIAASALVSLEVEGQTRLYLVVPTAGGRRLEVENVEIRTVTTSSPLGAALLGLEAGDEAEVPAPQGPRIHTVKAVC